MDLFKVIVILLIILILYRLYTIETLTENFQAVSGDAKLNSLTIGKLNIDSAGNITMGDNSDNSIRLKIGPYIMGSENQGSDFTLRQVGTPHLRWTWGPSNGDWDKATSKPAAQTTVSGTDTNKAIEDLGKIAAQLLAGGATVPGNLTVNSLKAGDATISGRLHTDSLTIAGSVNIAQNSTITGSLKAGDATLNSLTIGRLKIDSNGNITMGDNNDNSSRLKIGPFIMGSEGGGAFVLRQVGTPWLRWAWGPSDGNIGLQR